MKNLRKTSRLLFRRQFKHNDRTLVPIRAIAEVRAKAKIAPEKFEWQTG